MRLGGPIFETFTDPEAWIAAVRRAGYAAAICPLDETADDDAVKAFAGAAADADVVIAEVGAWSNPLARDAAAARDALELCRRRLDLADRIGARCCVNISGSRGEKWDGPHPDDLTEETFDAIVESVRSIIDDVKPTRTAYTLETMPWMYPDSTGSYLRLIDAIDRDGFAVHFDPVNLLSSPRRFFGHVELVRDFVARLGPRIRSCHAKDATMSDGFITHLDEVRPGTGRLDYPAVLTALDSLDPDTPLMLEHLDGAAEYALAAGFVRSAADAAGVRLR